MSILNLFRQSRSDTVAFANNPGDPGTMYRLGCRYANGVGVQKDYVQAYRWLHIAAARGHTEAGEVCQTIAARMSPQQIVHAEQLIAEAPAPC